MGDDLTVFTLKISTSHLGCFETLICLRRIAHGAQAGLLWTCTWRSPCLLHMDPFHAHTVYGGYNCNFISRSETKFHRMSHCMYNFKAWSPRHFITCKLLNCNYSHDIYLHLWYGHCFKLCCLVALISFWNVQIILSISHFNLLSNYIFTCFFFLITHCVLSLLSIFYPCVCSSVVILPQPIVGMSLLNLEKFVHYGISHR